MSAIWVGRVLHCHHVFGPPLGRLKKDPTLTTRFKSIWFGLQITLWSAKFVLNSTFKLNWNRNEDSNHRTSNLIINFAPRVSCLEDCAPDASSGDACTPNVGLAWQLVGPQARTRTPEARLAAWPRLAVPRASGRPRLARASGGGARASGVLTCRGRLQC
jgi:hypothetical protein